MTGLDEAVALLGAMSDREALLRVLLGLLRRWTGCDAVGVRLARGEDFPYYTTSGFSEAFVLAETRLCAKNADGSLARTPAGRAVLECICGAVIEGRVDPSLPFFTSHGSFFVGSTSRLLAEAEAEDLPPTTRNRCNTAGYETVVLVPLRAGGRTLGLLQVNDRRPDCLDAEAVAALERLAEGVAVLLARQETQQALVEAQALYRAVFFTNIAVKLLVDPVSGRIEDANQAASAFYGYPLEVLRRLSIWDINTCRPEEALEHMRAAREGRQGIFHFTHRLAGGELREVEVYSGPVEYAGQTLLFSIVHDVTNRVRAEQARERAEQVLRHDLRSPLAGIAGLANHLVGGGLSAEHREMAEVIRETATRLYTLVGRNLDLHKIEQGSYTLRPEPVPMAPFLAGMAREVATLAQARHVRLILAGEGFDDGGRGPSVAGEPDLLAILFSNLVTNALEAAPPGTAVRLTLKTVSARAETVIHNQGVVPEDIRPRFFKKYATSGKRNGTGLGAYNAMAVARLHGGDIDWESDAATGTRITVRLPLAAGVCAA
ncbi:PAS/PAC sensor signal transduction histidine kinase [Solidesulfovibrio fructosivorans JJ]]|uniref:histidine kinase n=2 Tax=Solidesulfovibrio fructosivorans TaxID=878 RepID=E1JTZ1_SOLFR|nr:PAS/PAC sensor signal transduction histidine kinase [Solidesulfovibrio fructosivorans JJ]]